MDRYRERDENSTAISGTRKYLIAQSLAIPGARDAKSRRLSAPIDHDEGGSGKIRKSDSLHRENLTGNGRGVTFRRATAGRVFR